jgi:hypothetical protein
MNIFNKIKNFILNYTNIGVVLVILVIIASVESNKESKVLKNWVTNSTVASVKNNTSIQNNTSDIAKLRAEVEAPKPVPPAPVIIVKPIIVHKVIVPVATPQEAPPKLHCVLFLCVKEK